MLELFVDEFGTGENNIYVDELSDDDVSASKNDGLKQRGFEKNIDKLLRHQLHWSKHYETIHRADDSFSSIEAEKIRCEFDKRIHSLDSSKSILSKISGLDYRYPGRIKHTDGSITYGEGDNQDEEAAEHKRKSSISEESTLTKDNSSIKASPNDDNQEIT